jgi:hypothetical protein
MPTLHWLTRETDLLLGRKVVYRLLDPVPDILRFVLPTGGACLA